MELSPADFEDLVAQALDGLPERFRARMQNVDVFVRDFASPHQLARSRVRSPWALLGLYEGVPLTQRTTGYNMVLPDRITLFRLPILTQCRTAEDVRREVAHVVMHEIGHHFGMSEQDLRSSGM